MLKQSLRHQNHPRSGKELSLGWKLGLTFLTLSILVGGALWLWKGVNTIISASSWGSFKSIKVEGISRLTEDVVIKAARVKCGGSLYKLPLDSIAARVSALPAVKTARARRRIPHQLAIQVEEREPLAALTGNPIRWVDREGMVFSLAKDGEVVDKPFLTGAAAKPKTPECKRAVALLVRIKDDYPMLYDYLSELSIEAKKVELRLTRGGAVVLTKVWNEDRLELLELYLKEKSAELPVDLRYLDMRCPNMIIAGTEISQKVRK